MHPFAEKFAAGWSNPSADRLTALLCDDVVLLQPHLPPLRGKAAAHAEFTKLFGMFPEFHGETFNAAGDDRQVFIEWRMRISRSDPAFIPAVDRITLRDGKVLERVVYFDQFRLARLVLARPSLWLAFIRYRFGS